MAKKTKWQAKVWSEKAHGGYDDIDYCDVWNLDERLADIISKHLHAFLKAEKGPNGGCPRIIVNQVGEEKAQASWLQIIRKMIYAFDEYQSVPNKYNIEPDKEARIKEGMQLFIDYFKYLVYRSNCRIQHLSTPCKYRRFRRFKAFSHKIDA